MNSDKCPSCGEKIKDGIIGSNRLLPPEAVALINEYNAETAVPDRCDECGGDLYKSAIEALENERSQLMKALEAGLTHIPITTIHSPMNWDYSVVSLITSQSVTGTGAFSELTSAFADFFGAQSGAYNAKLKAGEEFCKKLLRKQALDVGANAIVAVDIDYAEVGGQKGMLMVCMSGTAVTLKNPEILGSDATAGIHAIQASHSRLTRLARHGNPEVDTSSRREVRRY